jgi:hypothetical protein
MKLSLFELTNQAKILGFISLRIFMPAADGRVLEFVEEAYVIPEMNIPVLLGEDFQVNYEISMLWTAQEMRLLVKQPMEWFDVIAHSTPPFVEDFQVQQRHPPEIRDHTAYLAASRNPSYDQGHWRMPPLLKAERDVWICPGWVARIPVKGPVEGCDEWFMERVILPTRNGCFLAAPSMLVRTKELVVTVANTSPSTEWIQKGDILGVLHDPEQYLNRAEKEDQTQHLRAYAQVVQKIAQGSLGDKDLSDQVLAKSRALEIPSAPDELWGPETSEPADLVMYNSWRLEELIDIAPDAPPDIKAKTLALINKWIQASDSTTA